MDNQKGLNLGEEYRPYRLVHFIWWPIVTILYLIITYYSLSTGLYFWALIVYAIIMAITLPIVLRASTVAYDLDPKQDIQKSPKAKTARFFAHRRGLKFSILPMVILFSIPIIYSSYIGYIHLESLFHPIFLYFLSIIIIFDLAYCYLVWLAFAKPKLEDMMYLWVHRENRMLHLGNRKGKWNYYSHRLYSLKQIGKVIWSTNTKHRFRLAYIEMITTGDPENAETLMWVRISQDSIKDEQEFKDWFGKDLIEKKVTKEFESTLENLQ